MTYIRRNRKTRGLVQRKWAREYRGIADWVDWYWCECEHGTCTTHTPVKSLATEWMAHPWEWCEQCRAIVEAQE